MTGMLSLGRGAGTWLRVAVLALAAHAIVYRALLPADGEHSYFGWYAPLVAGVSAVALIATLGVMLARLAGIGESWVPRLAEPFEPSDGVAIAASRLAAKAVAFLVVQETLERSLPARSFELAQFTPVYWLVVLVVAALGALVLVSAARGNELLARRLALRNGAPAATRTMRCPQPRSVAVVPRHPLASFRGLRAPPSSIRV